MPGESPRVTEDAIPENTATIRVGRLVEIRIRTGYRSASEIDALFRAIAGVVAGKTDRPLVAVADWRHCPIMSEDASARALEGMTRNNPLVERSAALASRESPSAVLQFMRLVRDSNNAQRRLFYEADALIDWLGEVLTRREVQRLRSFLEEGGPAGSAGRRAVSTDE